MMDIEKILKEHLLWLKDEEGGERANLRGADLPHVVIFQAGKHQGLFCGGYGKIGCEKHTYKDWLDNGRQIGKKHDYSDAEIEAYMAMIEAAVKYLATVENER